MEREKIDFTGLHINNFLLEKTGLDATEEMLLRHVIGTKDSLTGINPKTFVDWNKNMLAPTKFDVAKFLSEEGRGSISDNYMRLSMSPVKMHPGPQLPLMTGALGLPIT